MVLAIIVVFVVAAAIWGVIGYMKGAPHGLAGQGVKYALLGGLFGMKKLNKKIEEKQRAEGAS